MKQIPLCPQCKSLEVRTELVGSLGDIGGVAPIFICQHCGFSSKIFPFTNLEKKNFRKALKEKN